MQGPVLYRAKIEKILKKDWFWLALIMTASVLFQLYRIGDAFGGFHSFNESHYASYAKSFLDQSIINILKESTDFNNPPLFSIFLYISYKLFGVSEASSRIVPIFFSAVSVYFTYKIGFLLYNKKVALFGAAFLAFCPAFILVGRNVQIESVFMAFILAALYFYIKSGKENEWKNRIIAGVLLGFGLFSKLPSILIIGAIIVWEIIRNRNFKWIKPSFISFITIPFIVPLPWVLYHLIFSPSSLAGTQTGIFEKVFEIPNAYVIYNIVLKEIFYAISPLLFLLSCCGLIVLILRRSESDYLIILLFGTYFLFYFFAHFHTYYLLPILPFASIMAAGYLSLIKKKLTSNLVLVTSLAVVLFSSLLLMASCKYGFDGLRNVANFINKDSSKEVVVATSDLLHGSYGPILKFYSSKIDLREVQDEVMAREIEADYYVDFGSRYRGQLEGNIISFNESHFLPIILGYAVYCEPSNIHGFGQNRLVIEKIGTSVSFGLEEIRVPTFILVELKGT